MSGPVDWCTPPEFFARYEREFDLNYDAAASHDNHLCNLYSTVDGTYRVDMGGRRGTLGSDGLDFSWVELRVWCNPPYSPAALLSRFIEKASESAKAGALVVMLLNATTLDTRYFHRFVWDNVMHRPRERVELRILPGRLRFLQPDGTPGGSPRHGNMIVIFHPHEK